MARPAQGTGVDRTRQYPNSTFHAGPARELLWEASTTEDGQAAVRGAVEGDMKSRRKDHRTFGPREGLDFGFKQAIDRLPSRQGDAL